jgi:hypothetical protein
MKFITMLVSSFNLSQSFNYTPYLFLQKTVQTIDQFFLNMDPAAATESELETASVEGEERRETQRIIGWSIETHGQYRQS